MGQDCDPLTPRLGVHGTRSGSEFGETGKGSSSPDRKNTEAGNLESAEMPVSMTRYWHKFSPELSRGLKSLDMYMEKKH